MIDQMQLELMAKINADATYDDANHSDETRRIAMKLFRSDLIYGTPVEGSDAAVDYLFLTDLGKLALTWYGPTSDDDAVVDWYALRMKQKLLKRSTDVTKGPLNWRGERNSLQRLFMRFMMEVGELAEVLFRLDEDEGPIAERMERIVDEAVDCGNLAMMIADFTKMVRDDAG